MEMSESEVKMSADWYNVSDDRRQMERPDSGSISNYNVRQRNTAAESSGLGRSISSQPSSFAPQSSDKRNTENVHRFAGVAVGLASVVSEHVLSHPCLVLRRQCQVSIVVFILKFFAVHNTARWYHLTPFTLFHAVFNIQRHQSITTMWKGIGSALMVKGIAVASESAIHELTHLPKDVDRHSSLKQMAQHVLLKRFPYLYFSQQQQHVVFSSIALINIDNLSLVIITPFYASSLVETVQSEIACERPGVFDCLVEGVSRFVSFTSAQPTRLLPIWKLITPTLLYGLCHYIIASLAKYRVSVTMKNEIMRKKDENGDESVEKTIYEMYYPELVAMFTGNLLADTLLYPLETILHRLYLQGTRTIIDNTDMGVEVVPIITRYEGAMDCYMTVVSEEGFGGLYKGFGALILQYALHMAILKLSRCLFEMMSGGGGKSKGAVVEVSRGVGREELYRRGGGDSWRPAEPAEQPIPSSRYRNTRNPYAIPDF